MLNKRTFVRKLHRILIMNKLCTSYTSNSNAAAAAAVVVGFFFVETNKTNMELMLCIPYAVYEGEIIPRLMFE